MITAGRSSEQSRARYPDEEGIDTGGFSLEALVSLVMTFNQGVELERLSGVSDGHAELMSAVDDWLARQTEANGR